MAENTLRHADLILPLPKGWSDASQIIAMGPIEDGFRTSLIVNGDVARDGESAEQYARRILPEVKKAAPGCDIVSEGAATFGVLSGWLREIAWSSAGLKLVQLQLHVISDGVARTFTYTQRADRIAATRAVAEHLFSAVRLGS
jgi:hypothetical protein